MDGRVGRHLPFLHTGRHTHAGDCNTSNFGAQKFGSLLRGGGGADTSRRKAAEDKLFDTLDKTLTEFADVFRNPGSDNSSSEQIQKHTAETKHKKGDHDLFWHVGNIINKSRNDRSKLFARLVPLVDAVKRGGS